MLQQSYRLKFSSLLLGEHYLIISARNVPQEGEWMAVQHNEIQELLKNRADLHDEPDRMHSSTRMTRPS